MTFPRASLRKFAKAHGAKRVGRAVYALLDEKLRRVAEEIARDAAVYAGAAGRKTIKECDVVAAIEFASSL